MAEENKQLDAQQLPTGGTTPTTGAPGPAPGGSPLAGAAPPAAPGTVPGEGGGGTVPGGGEAPSEGRGKPLTGSIGRQYVIAPRRNEAMQQMGVQPLAFNLLEQALSSSPDIEVVDILGPRGVVGTFADGMSGSPNVIIAKMSSEKAEILKQQGRDQLIVEQDAPLALLQADMSQPGMVMNFAAPAGPTSAVTIVVLGKDQTPVADAEVYIFGSMLPTRGATNANGEVTLSLVGETVQAVRGLYVKPKADYWSYYQSQPTIDPDQPNVVVLQLLSDWPAFSKFPQEQLIGWGQKAMRLDQLPRNYRGQGIKIAIVDSGAATTHQDLRNVRFGFDVINKRTNPNTWNEDTIAHGSHCAGVVAGADNALGLLGFCPDAEIHACKLFPGGLVSQLIDALEYCIEKQIDVVNLSLGGSEPSEALEQQIIRAKRLGVACIVAAGNSAGPVTYPASSPNVLAVAALGKMGEFPSESYHTQTVRTAGSEGYFSPKFTCFGPEIAVCAPGVAILSSVPPDNYAVWDGTSMAAPHVTGLAGLVLAHHPDFRGPFKERTAARVEQLFQIIKASAQPVNIDDPSRTGYGLPDVLVALGFQPNVAAQPALGPQAFGAPNTGWGQWTPQQAQFEPLGAWAGPTSMQQRSPRPIVRDHRSSPIVRDHRTLGGGIEMMNVDPMAAALAQQGGWTQQQAQSVPEHDQSRLQQAQLAQQRAQQLQLIQQQGPWPASPAFPGVRVAFTPAGVPFLVGG